MEVARKRKLPPHGAALKARLAVAVVSTDFEEVGHIAIGRSSSTAAAWSRNLRVHNHNRVVITAASASEAA